MASRISQGGSDGRSIGPGGVIAPAIGEDDRALGHGHIHAGRETQHIDDNDHITDGGQDRDPMSSPLTTDVEFLLIEDHDAVFSLSKTTDGLRLPNTRGEPRSKAGAQRTLEGVGCSARLCQNSPLMGCPASLTASELVYVFISAPLSGGIVSWKPASAVLSTTRNPRPRAALSPAQPTIVSP